jgi:hypothetical protein
MQQSSDDCIRPCWAAQWRCYPQGGVIIHFDAARLMQSIAEEPDNGIIIIR